MQRFFSLARLLIFVVIATLISATLNIQAAPLPQTTGPDQWSPHTRNVEGLPRLPGAEDSARLPDAADAVAIYSWSRLVFQSIRDNNWEIYLGNDDGSGQTRLTFDGNSDLHPRLNRGATRIAFASRRTGNYEIYTMNVDGTGLTRLTHNNADDIQPYWSPDGSKIAFQSYRDGQAEVYVMNADGSGQTRLTTNNDYDGEPAWSPNGAKIAFASRRSSSSSAYHIWVMNADGSNQTQLTVQEYCEGPVWSPDGTKIAYDAVGSDGWQNLWVVNADGSSPHVVFDEGGYADAWARSWSPDGRYIAFTRIYYTVYNNQLYWTNAYLDAWDSATNNVVRLSGSGADWRPDWQSTDNIAPSSIVAALPSVSPSPIRVRWSGTDSGSSGLQSFDIQVKDGISGTWTTWQSATTATSAYYPAVGGHTYYFRSRARDNAGNIEAWPASHDSTTAVETLPPISTVEALPPFSKDMVTVKWSGNDPGGSGIQTYDVQYQDVTAGGQWTTWQISVTTASAVFAGTTGHIYAFRSRALDRAQNQGDWSSVNGDAQTTFYAWAIAGQAHDNAGAPVVNVNVVTVPQAQGVLAAEFDGQYAAYVITSSNIYTASWTKNGYGSLPATAFNGSTGSSVHYQGTIPAQGNIVTINGLTLGQTYRIVLGGTFQYAGGIDNWADAQWSIAGYCTPGIFCYYSRNVAFNGILMTAQNGQNVADPNHEYTFLWTADTSELQMQIVDIFYSDNSGGLTYKVYSGSPDADLDIFLPPADNLIQNGDFEATDLASGGWLPSGAITPVLTSTIRHTGRQSVLLGTTVLSQTGNSAFAQVVTIPVTMTNPILSFLYQPGGISLLPNELVAYWQLDETSGMRFDATARGNNLADTNTVTSTAGKLGNAAQFVAANHQHLNLADNTDLSTGDIDFTIAGWVYLDVPKTNGVAVGKADATTFSTIEYALGYEGYMDRFAGSVGNGSGGGASVIANTFGSPAANQWYFVAFWHDSVNNQIGISVNGVSDVVSYSGGVADGFHEFRLGDDLDGRWWNGRLDEIGFWKRVLTAEELAALYNNGQGLTYPFGTSDSGGMLDVQVADGITTTTVFTTALNTADWTHHWLDLSTWKGQTITVTFAFHQNMPGLSAWMYLDEVSLGSGHPDAWVQLANPPIAQPGGTVTYQLTYGNQGGAPASNVQLTATLPVQLTFVEASNPPTITTTSLVWNLGELLAQNGPNTILITATVTPTITDVTVVSSTVDIATTTTELEKANNTYQTNVTIKYDVFLPIIALE